MVYISLSHKHEKGLLFFYLSSLELQVRQVQLGVDVTCVLDVDVTCVLDVPLLER
jgi:hypothetical protein